MHQLVVATEGHSKTEAIQNLRQSQNVKHFKYTAEESFMQSNRIRRSGPSERVQMVPNPKAPGYAHSSFHVIAIFERGQHVPCRCMTTRVEQ